MDSLLYNSVETLPGYETRAAFTVSSSSVFREDTDIVSIILNDKLSYIPWGGDNQMPFHIIDLIEKDETLATCQLFNAEVCFGSGLRYDTCIASASVKRDVARQRPRLILSRCVPKITTFVVSSKNKYE